MINLTTWLLPHILCVDCSGTYWVTMVTSNSLMWSANAVREGNQVITLSNTYTWKAFSIFTILAPGKQNLEDASFVPCDGSETWFLQFKFLLFYMVNATCWLNRWIVENVFYHVLFISKHFFFFQVNVLIGVGSIIWALCVTHNHLQHKTICKSKAVWFAIYGWLNSVVILFGIHCISECWLTVQRVAT